MGFERRGRLARRLLYVIFQTVLQTSLYGCVVPTSLEQEQKVNYPPVLVTSQVMPPFGPISYQPSDVVEFKLVADDANGTPVLNARLFRLGSTPASRVFTGIETTLSAPNPPDEANPNRRIGSIGPVQPCTALGENTYYVVVADEKFIAGTANSLGLTTENHWELSCQ